MKCDEIWRAPCQTSSFGLVSKGWHLLLRSGGAIHTFSQFHWRQRKEKEIREIHKVLTNWTCPLPLPLGHLGHLGCGHLPLSLGNSSFFVDVSFFHFVRQLGVDTNASATDIRRAYFQKSRQVASVSCQESIRLKQIEAVSRLKYWRNLVKKSWKIKEHTVSREVPWMRQCHPDKTADEDAKVSMTWVWRECDIILRIYNVSHNYAFMIHDHII